MVFIWMTFLLGIVRDKPVRTVFARLGSHKRSFRYYTDVFDTTEIGNIETFTGQKSNDWAVVTLSANLHKIHYNRDKHPDQSAAKRGPYSLDRLVFCPRSC